MEGEGDEIKSKQASKRDRTLSKNLTYFCYTAELSCKISVDTIIKKRDFLKMNYLYNFQVLAIIFYER